MTSFLRHVSYGSLAVFGFTCLTSTVPEARAATITDQQNLVDNAALAVQTIFHQKKNDSRAKRLLGQSKAVMICPSLVNISLVFGGMGGRCLLLSRDARGSWSDPAFYHLSGGSFGVQFGYQDSQLILFIVTQRGIQALLDHQFTFDSAAAASFANMSSNAQDKSVSGASSDIYALQRSSGVFVGASLGGTKLSTDSQSNRTYYGQSVGPEDIVVNMRVNNVAADPLRRALMDATPPATQK